MHQDPQPHRFYRFNVGFLICLAMCVLLFYVALVRVAIQSATANHPEAQTQAIVSTNGTSLDSLPKGFSGYNQPHIEPMTPDDLAEIRSKGNNTRDSFRILVGFTHFNYDDPIVYPGKPNASHLHMFAGNSNMNASVTRDNIRDCSSMSQGGTANCSGYWIPAVVDAAGVPQVPHWHINESDDPRMGKMMVYYKSYGVANSLAFQAPPLGFKMIAGNASNTPDTPQNTQYIRWQCLDGATETALTPNQPYIPVCQPNDMLFLTLQFPQCWDGVNLDSPNHQSHTAYSADATCPASHPVAIPQISYLISFKTGEQGTAGWRVASDSYPVSPKTPGGHSIHADWFNGWDTQIMSRLVNNCIHREVDCGVGNLNDGERLAADFLFASSPDEAESLFRN